MPKWKAVTVSVRLKVDPDEDLDFVDVEDSVRCALEIGIEELPPGVELDEVQAEED